MRSFVYTQFIISLTVGASAHRERVAPAGVPPIYLLTLSILL